MRDEKEERTKQARSNKHVHVHVYTLMCIVLSHAGSNLLKVTLNLLRLGPNASRQFAAHAAVTGVKKSEHSFLHSTSHLFFVASHLHLYTSHITSHLHITFAHLHICTSHTALHICTFFALHLHFFFVASHLHICFLLLL